MRRPLSGTGHLTYRCQAQNSHVVSHVALPAPMGRSLVALSPYGLTHARGRRGGSIGTGTWPAIPASGSFQMSACLRLDVYVMARTGANGAIVYRADIVMRRKS